MELVNTDIHSAVKHQGNAQPARAAMRGAPARLKAPKARCATPFDPISLILDVIHLLANAKENGTTFWEEVEAESRKPFILPGMINPNYGRFNDPLAPPQID
jgi:hypothetical protein